MSIASRDDRSSISCSSLAARKVLVIEADVLVSMVIEDILVDQESVVIGPFTELQPALEAAHSAEVDFALLDVSHRSVTVFPVVEALSSRGVPFLLLSSYGAEAVPADRPEWRILSKPFSGGVLVRKMLQELDKA